tara:strand:+ start:1246 stop:2133 length:888 start_codon:yes stop_codon:yes gene_type:complete
MTSFFKSVFIAIRPKTLSASIAPVLVGSAIAFNSSQFNLRIFFLTIFSAIFIQIGTNFANDVYDFINGADNDERVGPTRAVQANLISVNVMKYLTIIAFSLSVICGLPLVIKGGYPILLIGILSIISGYAYTGGPYPLGYNGWGDIFVFIFFGPIAVCGTFFLQLGYVSIESLVSGIVMGCLSVTLLCINNIRDVDTDSNVGKRTIAVRFGVMFVKYLFISLFLICYLLLGYLSFNLNYINKNVYFLLLIITLPLCLKLNFDIFKLKLHSLNRLLSNVSVFIIVFSLLFILSILI